MSTDRSGQPDAPRGTVLRRLLTAAAGLAVTALAACAFVLTYDVLCDAALAGRVPRRWAWAYPVMTDVLVAVVILSLVVARHARWWSRFVRWTLLAALLAGMAALGVQHAVWGLASLPDDQLRAGVAIAPEAVLIIGVWLWLTMLRQARAGGRRPAPAEAAKPAAPAPAQPPPIPWDEPAPQSFTPPAAVAASEQLDPHPRDEPAPKLTVPMPAAARPALEPEPEHGPEPELEPEPEPEAGAEAKTVEIPAPDEDADLTLVDRAEDPDAGDDTPTTTRTFTPGEDAEPNGDAGRTDGLAVWDWDPPSGSLRSSPTPPGDTERAP
ncbi:hypothetical protein Acsp04_63340 [Actinomadura sp. NBRC 104425]|uniref:hypothetical protein n=1 Tax=Actinomadura sp. NBRC 104425 TaxID=3032204 RepID=UPI0024A5D1BF|nr:hypothetical protein [Actinomadura sp. NBRC 104425]GLZ16099.1 hypothetical protein Acsp04_63340 [Actinomadura sp. NBRC 104425]